MNFRGAAEGAPRQTTGGSDIWRMGIVIVLWLAATAWMRPLMLPDEGRYVGVAWEMLRSGDWLTPTLDGLPFFHKPPLFYWITAGALHLFGMNEWAGRAASLLGASMAAWSLYVFTRRWSGVQSAQRALWVLLAQPLFFVGAQFANLDMLVAGCIVATVLALAHVALSLDHQQPTKYWLVCGYGLAGLGVLAKGLIGFVLPAMVISIWLLLRGRWRTLLRLLSLPGVGVFLIVVLPWFVAMQQRFDGFLHYFFVVQHVQRFAQAGFNNVQPWWFYPAVLALLSLPSLIWAKALLTRRFFFANDQHDAQPAVRQLMALFAGCIVLFFSLPQSKLVGYVLPAVPPLAWLMAQAAGGGADGRVGRGRAWWLTWALGVALGLGVVIGLAVDQRHSGRALGLALHAQRHSDEPVFMLDNYAYDTPFYARLTELVPVVGDWKAPEIQRHDNWRKEIADAGEFDVPRARQVLIDQSEWMKRMCATPISWVIAPQAMLAQDAVLQAAAPIYQGRDLVLLRVDGASAATATALNCTR